MFLEKEIVPEKKTGILQFLDEIRDSLNDGDGCCATGNITFEIQEPKTNEHEWEIKVSGQISDGQDNDGNEIWKNIELQDHYFGKTLKDAAEQLYSDYIGIR